MLRIVDKRVMKRDPTLFRVELLDTDRMNVNSINNWCESQKILTGYLKFTMFNGEVTVVCTEAQLSMILLKFSHKETVDI